MGRKKRPSYRIVVAEARAPRDGAFIDNLGYYNPLTDPETVVIDEEKARRWLRHGAQPTEAVARFLTRLGIGTRETSKGGGGAEDASQET
jgi:small subunit ribosomal protein S16